MNNKFKKQISIALSTALLATSCIIGTGDTADAKKAVILGNTAAKAAGSMTAPYAARRAASSSADFSLTVNNSSWENGFNASIDLNNLLDDNVTDWTLTLDNVSFSIDSIWCASAKKSGNSYVISNMGWNSTIISGSYISFGFCASGTLPETLDFSVTYLKNGTQYIYTNNGTTPVISPSPVISTSPSPSATVSVSPSPSATISTSPSPSAVVSTSPSPSSSASLINAPLNQFHRTMPSTGNVKAIMLIVDFPDVTFSNRLSLSEIKDALYGDGNTSSSNYPFESSKAYYKRASYGNLNFTGDVFTYTAKNNRSYYVNKNEYETLMMEVMTALDSQIDYSQYDSNSDGIIDNITINVPLNGTSDDDFFYGCQATWYINNNFSVDGMKVYGYIMDDAQPSYDNISYYNCVYCHESGHLMGLPDYYKYNSSDWQGMNGIAGYELMDDMYCDLSSFSKLMYGWLKTNEVQVYDTSKSSQTFTISSASTTGDCIILPIGNLDSNYFSEYFIIEYISNEGNNKGFVGSGGIRMIHVDAETIYSYDGYKEFKYANFSSYYDTSDSKQRVVYLVNDNNGFYTSGSTVTYGTKNFAGFDSSGNQTVNTGYSVSIGAFSNGQYTITVTK